MRAHPDLIQTPEALEALCQKLRSSPMIGIDTEFIRERTFFPIIALVQVSTEDESYLIDPIALDPDQMKPFLEILGDPQVLKIMHAAQADQECLYTSYGVIAKPSLDTAVAASLAGFGDSVGLSRLVKELLGVSLQKGHARTDWTVRPLPKQLLHYAHLDVQYLIPLAKIFQTKLEKTNRKDWALELSARFEDTKLYELDAFESARKIMKNKNLDARTFAALIELVRWRDDRVRRINVPRRRVADDDVLIDLAATRPRDMDHLSAFRGINRGELNQSGTAILSAINKAEDIPQADLPVVPHPDIPSNNEARIIEFLQYFVRTLADDLQISARHLVGADSLLTFVRKGTANFHHPDDLVRAGVLTQGATKLIGEELIAVASGRRALSIAKNRIHITKS